MRIREHSEDHAIIEIVLVALATNHCKLEFVDSEERRVHPRRHFGQIDLRPAIAEALAFVRGLDLRVGTLIVRVLYECFQRPKQPISLIPAANDAGEAFVASA